MLLCLAIIQTNMKQNNIFQTLEQKKVNVLLCGNIMLYKNVSLGRHRQNNTVMVLYARVIKLDTLNRFHKSTIRLLI